LEFLPALLIGFQKLPDFKLNERLGKYAFWCWLIGFFMAFHCLFIYWDSWERREDWIIMMPPLAGSRCLSWPAGLVVITLGVMLQVLQIIVSIRQRKQNLDTTGDPWNGRTLEWATSSPPPHYNFAIIPKVRTAMPSGK
jgi:cytochrome o ubiquinol oxidase subunit 1